MRTTDTPSSPHDQQLAELTQQHAEALAKSDELGRQIKAAVRREADLRKQLNDSQTELAKLGFMQLGKKMIVKAEVDNHRKKLAANQQLQESLKARLQACSEQLAALEAQIAAARVQPAPAPSAPVMPAPASVEAPVPVETPIPVIAPTLPVADESAPPPILAAPAPRQKAAAPRLSVPRQPAAARVPRAPRLDTTLPLEEQVSQLLARLEALYPERQVFALGVLSAELYTRLNALAAQTGCTDPAEFLQRHGFTVVTGAQGRALHLGKYCTPGQEPAVIRPLLTSVLRRLEKSYPEHIIPRSIQQDHKRLAQDVSSLSQWLGYDRPGDLLTAYGYTYQARTAGRPTTDVQALLQALRAAYPGEQKPRAIQQIMSDHPELAHSLKTLQNQAMARFGMPLKQYLTEQGILAGPRTK